VAIDLADLLPDLRAEINPPGTDLYPNASNADLVNRLRNAFWEARLQGAFPTYAEADGVIAPLNGSTDLPREQQQLVILFAGLNIVLADYRNVQATFKAQAGPVAYETGRSAQLLKTVLDTIKAKLGAALDAAVNGPSWSGSTTVFDAVMARTDSLSVGDTWWVR
jgi:hypothetical protein